MLHLTEGQVLELLPMARAIELVEQGFLHLAAGRAVNHPRRRLHLADSAMLHYMAAADLETGYLGSKLYTTHPKTGFHFVLLLFSSQGEALATIEANHLGQIRTGAASAVATRRLARPQASVVGLIGAGFQARSQLEAVALVRPLSDVRVYSRSDHGRRAFAQEMGAKLGIRARPVESAEEAVRGADIVITATTAREPVLAGEWLSPGSHVNAVGANHPKRRELDDAAVRQAGVVVADSVDQSRLESGDLIEAFRLGAGSWDQVVELADLLANRHPGRRSREEITLFKSNGLALEDLSVAGYVYEQATPTSASAAQSRARR